MTQEQMERELRRLRLAICCLIPPQEGNGGESLVTDGTSLSWQTVLGGAITDGSGTTANGTSVDLGGTLSSNADILLGANDFSVGSDITSGILFQPSSESVFIGDVNALGNETSILVDDANQDIYLSADKLFLNSTLAGASNGDVWTLIDDSTGEGEWQTPATASYLAYTALLTQTGTDAPTVTVLENTLGGTVVWTRDDVGSYKGTLAGAFVNNKTIPGTSGNVGIVGNGQASTTPADYVIQFFKSATDEDTVNLVVYDLDFNQVELSTILDIGGTQYTISIEIRVYP